MTKHLLGSALCLVGLSTGCAVPFDFQNTPTAGAADVATGDSKADDYLSPIGREYDFQTTLVIALSEEEADLDDPARVARAQELASAEMSALTEALDTLIWERWDEDTRIGDSSLMLRQMSDTIADPRPAENGSYEFAYLVEAAGPSDLFDRFPFDGQDLQHRLLNVSLGAGDELREYEIRVTHSEASTDSYPEYGELFEGGLDIAIHIGDDHRTEDKDIRQARSVYDALTDTMGFSSPVNDFDDLALDSGAFENFISVEGEQVRVRVRLYHANMADDTELDRLVDAYRESARTADIVIYEGHAGRSLDYSGVVLHYGPRAAIPAAEFRNLELPDKYQIFVFSGCETYTGYSESLFAHEGKTTRNADVITTVNFTTYRARSTGSVAMLQALTQTREGTWYPLSWGAALKHINDFDAGGKWTAMYGVHGLDDNPRVSPLGDLNTIGQPCQEASECPGVDSRCVTRHSGARECGVACTDDSGCPQGTRCIGVTSRAHGSLRQCLTSG